ncbi:MAG: hypothetical protein CSA50_04135 [Gammaproteobacteria bacterium]|nr:MAG: hypothetical protein CSA50_04135 [Gammaproteobacteria bacterium]
MKGLFILCILLLGIVMPVGAVQVKDLYVASVPVDSRDTSSLSSSFRVALEKVLMKMSGNRAYLSNTQIQRSLKQASRYVQQYSFVKNVNYRASAPITPANSPYWLKVRFLEKALMQFFTDSDEAIWGRNRPSVIVWTVYEKNRQRKILAGSETNSIVTAITQSARQWGLPVFLPVMDLADKSNISASDLWESSVDRLIFASARYKPDIIAVLRVGRNVNGSWQGRWALIQNQTVSKRDASASSRVGLIRSMMEAMSAYIARQYAVSSGPDVTGEVVMNVSGVNSYRQYVALSQYLSGLAPVKNTQVASVESGRASILLDIRGPVEKLKQHINLDSVLVPELSSVGVAGDIFAINYRWNTSGESEN